MIAPPAVGCKRMLGRTLNSLILPRLRRVHCSPRFPRQREDLRMCGHGGCQLRGDYDFVHLDEHRFDELLRFALEGCPRISNEPVRGFQSSIVVS